MSPICALRTTTTPPEPQSWDLENRVDSEKGRGPYHGPCVIYNVDFLPGADPLVLSPSTLSLKTKRGPENPDLLFSVPFEGYRASESTE